MSLHDQIRHHLARGEFSAARPLLERAARGSSDPQLLFALARVLHALGEKEPAAYQASRAIAASLNSPHEASVRIAAGELIQDSTKPAEAVRIFREGVARFPAHGGMRAGLINALRADQQPGHAGDEATRALAEFPGDVLLHLIGAGALGDSLRQSHARDALLRAVSLAPADPRVLIPAATMLHYCDGIEPAQVTEIHRRAGQALANSVGPRWHPTGRDATLGRRLKIALVSCDFRDHAVARFLEPWLTHRDRIDSEYTAVSLRGPEDATTARLKPLFDHWIDATNKPDDQIAAIIRAAKPDIAIDLAGLHVTARPGAFARRVAPIQVTYLGYAGTTGIPAMDYRLVDSITDPPGAENLCTEQLFRMQEPPPRWERGLGVGSVERKAPSSDTQSDDASQSCFLCFSPDPRAPEPSSTAPQGSLTFCSFNAQQKITDTTLDLWATALRAVPHALLLLKSRALTDPRTREILNAALVSRSIDPSRVEVAPHAPDYRAHLETYNRADIALDTFPYNGTTTTCEALHMGVPVITLAGHAHASRVGASLLQSAGQAEQIATTGPEFGVIAGELAARIAPTSAPVRADAKRTARARFLASGVCDGRGFANRLDWTVRSLWESSV